MTDIEKHPDFRGLMQSASKLMNEVNVQLSDRMRRQASFIGAMDRIYRHWDEIERKHSEAIERADVAEADLVRLRERSEAAAASYRQETEAEIRRSQLAIAQMQQEADDGYARLTALHAEEMAECQRRATARVAVAECGRAAAEGALSTLNETLRRMVSLVETGNALMSEENVGMSEAIDTLRRRLEESDAPRLSTTVPALEAGRDVVLRSIA